MPGLWGVWVLLAAHIVLCGLSAFMCWTKQCDPATTAINAARTFVVSSIMTMTTTTRFDRRRTGGALSVVGGHGPQVGGLDFFRVALLEDQDEREDRLGR